MKKCNKKNRQPRDRKPRQNRQAVPFEAEGQKLVVNVQCVAGDAITIPRAEYDDLVNDAHLLDMTEALCKCRGHYTAADFLRYMIGNRSTDGLDGALGMDTPVTLDRAEYRCLSRASGLLNAIVGVSGRGSDYDLSSMLELLFPDDGKVKEE